MTSIAPCCRFFVVVPRRRCFFVLLLPQCFQHRCSSRCSPYHEVVNLRKMIDILLETFDEILIWLKDQFYFFDHSPEVVSSRFWYIISVCSHLWLHVGIVDKLIRRESITIFNTPSIDFKQLNNYLSQDVSVRINMLSCWFIHVRAIIRTCFNISLFQLYFLPRVHLPCLFSSSSSLRV